MNRRQVISVIAGIAAWPGVAQAVMAPPHRSVGFGSSTSILVKNSKARIAMMLGHSPSHD